MPSIIESAHLWIAAIVFVGALLCSEQLRAAPESSYPPLFGSREVRSPNTAVFNKWTRMLARQKDEPPTYESPCLIRRQNRCYVENWRMLLAQLRNREPLTQIEAVNTFMNQAPYVTDPVNWGVPDYWATPLQFLAKDGDCEDYAIAKYISLRDLGFSSTVLRIVVLEDLNLKAAHAVLVVYHEGRALILDNQVQSVVPAERIRHYRPVYSINEDAWWLHRP